MGPARGNTPPPHPQHPSKRNDPGGQKHPWIRGGPAGKHPRSEGQFKTQKRGGNIESSNAKREQRPMNPPQPEKKPSQTGITKHHNRIEAEIFSFPESKAAFLKAAPFHKSFILFTVFYFFFTRYFRFSPPDTNVFMGAKK